MDSSKYPVPDDWLETSERNKKRKAMRLEANCRMEARAKNEAKVNKPDAQEAKTDTSKKQEAGVGEGKYGVAAGDESAKGNDTEGNKDGLEEDGDEKDANNKTGDSKAKRPREVEGGQDEEEEEDLEEIPPMYRQARGLFLAPDVRSKHDRQTGQPC